MKLSNDTIQTVTRCLLKMLTGILMAHGAQKFFDPTSIPFQAAGEEIIGAALTGVLLWWSKKHQTSIAQSGNTTTFTIPPKPPGIPPTPPAPPKP